MPFAEVREQVAQACHRLAAEGLVLGTAGNTSVRLGDLVAVTATGVRFDRATPEQVVVVDLEGRLVHGELAPTSELELHLGVHADVGVDGLAVVHTHAPVGTSVGLLVDELPCVHYAMLLLGGSVRVAPYATFGSPELATGVRAALAGRSAALMANHGTVVHGLGLEAALDKALLLEWACDVWLRAASVGTPRALTPDQQGAVVEAALRTSYGTTRTAGGTP